MPIQYGWALEFPNSKFCSNDWAREFPAYKKGSANNLSIDHGPSMYTLSMSTHMVNLRIH